MISPLHSRQSPVLYTYNTLLTYIQYTIVDYSIGLPLYFIVVLVCTIRMEKAVFIIHIMLLYTLHIICIYTYIHVYRYLYVCTFTYKYIYLVDLLLQVLLHIKILFIIYILYFGEFTTERSMSHGPHIFNDVCIQCYKHTYLRIIMLLRIIFQQLMCHIYAVVGSASLVK